MTGQSRNNDNLVRGLVSSASSLFPTNPVYPLDKLTIVTQKATIEQQTDKIAKLEASLEEQKEISITLKDLFLQKVKESNKWEERARGAESVLNKVLETEENCPGCGLNS